MHCSVEVIESSTNKQHHLISEPLVTSGNLAETSGNLAGTSGYLWEPPSVTAFAWEYPVEYRRPPRSLTLFRIPEGAYSKQRQ
jgi:hypothetical protein